MIRTEGLKYTLQAICRHVLLRSSASHLLEPIVPPVYEQKLWAFDSLGYWPHIRSPRSFNEKLIHRKLFTDNACYSTITDKWAVRSYVSETVGEQLLTDVYHVTDDPDTIPFESLPDEFVIKPTHGSGWIRVIENKHETDFEALRMQCREWLSETYGRENRLSEYWYWEIEPRLIVEQYLQSETNTVPRDYKFYVFHGNVEYIEVHFDRFDAHTQRLYTRTWEPTNVTQPGYPQGPDINPPSQLAQMIDIAESLAAPFDFIRVDLYHPTADQIIFGELTLTPDAGLTGFRPVAFDFELGDLWNLETNTTTP